MERVAIPIWQGRISPVLDTAERLCIFELGSGDKATSRIVELLPDDIRQRTDVIRCLGVSTLLCGAVSRPLQQLLLSVGVVVRPWLAGPVHEVLAAYREGRLDAEYFQLPSCGRRRQRGRSVWIRGRRGKS